MTTQQEREIFSERTEEIIREAAGKNKFAYQYLNKLMNITRIIDDMYDNDQTVTASDILGSLEFIVLELPYNPFFMKHRDSLTSQHVSMYNAWMAANIWGQGDETDKIYAHVWRDTHHEVVPLVALLTQGPEKMRYVSMKIRQLFKKHLGE
jgi:hypothetical protein|tara:strand:- start:8251 stop:8703 length:453 start_codon:yes stop_codon:yes gene_type:complete